MLFEHSFDVGLPRVGFAFCRELIGHKGCHSGFVAPEQKMHLQSGRITWELSSHLSSKFVQEAFWNWHKWICISLHVMMCTMILILVQTWRGAQFWSRRCISLSSLHGNSGKDLGVYLHVQMKYWMSDVLGLKSSKSWSDQQRTRYLKATIWFELCLEKVEKKSFGSPS